MDTSKIAIQIASEFTGSKAFKKAETSAQKLERTVKNLAKTLGVAFSTAAVVRFGKESVKAFVADEKAAAILTKTLGNLGLAFEDKRLKNYVSELEASTGVLDSELRPALQTILTTTGSVTKSQELLGLAIDMAAGSGESLATTSKDLALAFVGNVKGLTKYNTGLTKTELQTTTFVNLQEKLNDQFSGQNAAYLETYAGQVGLLNVAYDNMQETIGEGLIDSFSVLAGDQGIGGATTAMERFGRTSADVLVGLASYLKKIMPESADGGGFNWLALVPVLGGYFGPGGVIEKLAKEGRRTLGTDKQYGGIYGTNFQKLQTAAEERARAAAEEKALKRARELQAIEKKRLDNIKKIAAEKAKKLALDKLSAFLNNAEKLFDIDRIQLAAAAMSKQTEEDKVRIRLKQELLDLEDAINNGNVEAAAKLAQSVYNDAKLLGEIRGTMLSLGDVPDPFAAWLSTLEQMLATLLAMTEVVPVIIKMIGMGGFNVGSARMGESAGNAAAGLPANSLTDFMGFGDTHLGALATQSSNATTINYNINATGIGDQQIASVVQNAIQDLNRYGNSTTYAGAI